MTLPNRSRQGRHTAALVVSAIVILAIVALLVFGRGVLGWWSRRMATRELNVGAISAAQQWLAWSAWTHPDDGRMELIQAACFRQLRQDGRFAKALELAQQKGAPAAQVEQEFELGLIQSGAGYEGTRDRLLVLIDAGVPTHEVAGAFVYGALARNEPEAAQEILDAWRADFPEDAHLTYMQGVYWAWLGERERAQLEFERALARQPRHERARTALAELQERSDQLDQALEQYVELTTRHPASEVGEIGLARVLRKLGRVGQSRAVLKRLAAQSEAMPGVAVETGHLDLDSGNYEEAERSFEQAGLDEAHLSETLRAAATTFAFAGEITRAERLFARIDAARSRSLRLKALRARLADDPNDSHAADELEPRSSTSTTPHAAENLSVAEQAEKDPPQSPVNSGPELYAFHCRACHGASGDGKGRAARHLFPKPRDLRTGKYRLVSTLNGVPTLEDLQRVIKRGMPGTSMQSFDNLSENHLKLLALEVRRLNQDGIRAQCIDTLRIDGEELDNEDIEQILQVHTTPGEVVHAPLIGPADPQAIERGKQIFSEVGCNRCHGDDGGGARDVFLVDDKGRPTRPRDLAHEAFKGGHEPESVYLRLFVGMPGSPHPACWPLSEEKLVDLVHYCRWLSREPKRLLTNYQRATLVTSRAYLEAFGGSPPP